MTAPREGALPYDAGDGREPPDWFDRLHPNGALFAVDLDQRVTRWNPASGELLGDAEGATGRHCYEVMASMDPRNRPFCRPSCPVIAAARHGRPLPDFEVWVGARDGAPAQVTILLSEDEDSLEILHLVREAKPGARPEPRPRETSPAENLRPMLSVIGRTADPAQEATGTLTSRQREVLAGLAAGESPRAIAQRLGLSVVTVRNHIQTAMSCLGAHTRLEAVITAVERGIL